MGRAIVNYDFTDGREQDVMSNIDGNLVPYAVEYSTMGVPNPNIIEDRNLANGEISSGDFYDASGGMGGDDFYDATGSDNDTFAEDSMPDSMIDRDFDNALGRGKKGKKRGKSFFNKLLDVQSNRQKMKFGAKDKMAQAQLESARQQGALAQSDVATANAIANASKSSGSNNEKTGWSALSTGAKVGIVVGGVAVLGFVGYMLLRKKK
jgi:hypothetical protein